MLEAAWVVRPGSADKGAIPEHDYKRAGRPCAHVQEAIAELNRGGVNPRGFHASYRAFTSQSAGPGIASMKILRRALGLAGGERGDGFQRQRM